MMKLQHERTEQLRNITFFNDFPPSSLSKRRRVAKEGHVVII